MKESPQPVAAKASCQFQASVASSIEATVEQSGMHSSLSTFPKAKISQQTSMSPSLQLPIGSPTVSVDLSSNDFLTPTTSQVMSTSLAADRSRSLGSVPGALPVSIPLSLELTARSPEVCSPLSPRSASSSRSKSPRSPRKNRLSLEELVSKLHCRSDQPIDPCLSPTFLDNVHSCQHSICLGTMQRNLICSLQPRPDSNIFSQHLPPSNQSLMNPVSEKIFHCKCQSVVNTTLGCQVSTSNEPVVDSQPSEVTEQQSRFPCNDHYIGSNMPVNPKMQSHWQDSEETDHSVFLGDQAPDSTLSPSMTKTGCSVLMKEDGINSCSLTHHSAKQRLAAWDNSTDRSSIDRVEISKSFSKTCTESVWECSRVKAVESLIPVVTNETCGIPACINSIDECHKPASSRMLPDISKDNSPEVVCLSSSSSLSSSSIQSASNTPMFSDTPSDTSRSSLVVKISDAVAAILSSKAADKSPTFTDALLPVLASSKDTHDSHYLGPEINTQSKDRSHGTSESSHDAQNTTLVGLSVSGELADRSQYSSSVQADPLRCQISHKRYSSHSLVDKEECCSSTKECDEWKTCISYTDGRRARDSNTVLDHRIDPPDRTSQADVETVPPVYQTPSCKRQSTNRDCDCCVHKATKPKEPTQETISPTNNIREASLQRLDFSANDKYGEPLEVLDFASIEKCDKPLQVLDLASKEKRDEPFQVPNSRIFEDLQPSKSVFNSFQSESTIPSHIFNSHDKTLYKDYKYKELKNIETEHQTDKTMVEKVFPYNFSHITSTSDLSEDSLCTRPNSKEKSIQACHGVWYQSASIKLSKQTCSKIQSSSEEVISVSKDHFHRNDTGKDSANCSDICSSTGVNSTIVQNIHGDQNSNLTLERKISSNCEHEPNWPLCNHCRKCSSVQSAFSDLKNLPNRSEVYSVGSSKVCEVLNNPPTDTYCTDIAKKFLPEVSAAGQSVVPIKTDQTKLSAGTSFIQESGDILLLELTGGTAKQFIAASTDHIRSHHLHGLKKDRPTRADGRKCGDKEGMAKCQKDHISIQKGSRPIRLKRSRGLSLPVKTTKVSTLALEEAQMKNCDEQLQTNDSTPAPKNNSDIFQTKEPSALNMVIQSQVRERDSHFTINSNLELNLSEPSGPSSQRIELEKFPLPPVSTEIEESRGLLLPSQLLCTSASSKDFDSRSTNPDHANSCHIRLDKGCSLPALRAKCDLVSAGHSSCSKPVSDPTHANSAKCNVIITKETNYDVSTIDNTISPQRVDAKSSRDSVYSIVSKGVSSSSQDNKTHLSSITVESASSCSVSDIRASSGLTTDDNAVVRPVPAMDVSSDFNTYKAVCSDSFTASKVSTAATTTNQLNSSRMPTDKDVSVTTTSDKTCSASSKTVSCRKDSVNTATLHFVFNNDSSGITAANKAIVGTRVPNTASYCDNDISRTIPANKTIVGTTAPNTVSSCPALEENSSIASYPIDKQPFVSSSTSRSTSKLGISESKHSFANCCKSIAANCSTGRKKLDRNFCTQFDSLPGTKPLSVAPSDECVEVDVAAIADGGNIDSKTKKAVASDLTLTMATQTDSPGPTTECDVHKPLQMSTSSEKAQNSSPSQALDGSAHSVNSDLSSALVEHFERELNPNVSCSTKLMSLKSAKPNDIPPSESPKCELPLISKNDFLAIKSDPKSSVNSISQEKESSDSSRCLSLVPCVTTQSKALISFPISKLASVGVCCSSSSNSLDLTENNAQCSSAQMTNKKKRCEKGLDFVIKKCLRTVLEKQNRPLTGEICSPSLVSSNIQKIFPEEKIKFQKEDDQHSSFVILHGATSTLTGSVNKSALATPAQTTRPMLSKTLEQIALKLREPNLPKAIDSNPDQGNREVLAMCRNLVSCSDALSPSLTLTSMESANTDRKTLLNTSSVSSFGKACAIDSHYNEPTASLLKISEPFSPPPLIVLHHTSGEESNENNFVEENLRGLNDLEADVSAVKVLRQQCERSAPLFAIDSLESFAMKEVAKLLPNLSGEVLNKSVLPSAVEVPDRFLMKPSVHFNQEAVETLASGATKLFMSGNTSPKLSVDENPSGQFQDAVQITSVKADGVSTENIPSSVKTQYLFPERLNIFSFETKKTSLEDLENVLSKHSMNTLSIENDLFHQTGMKNSTCCQTTLQLVQGQIPGHEIEPMLENARKEKPESKKFPEPKSNKQLMMKYDEPLLEYVDMLIPQNTKMPLPQNAKMPMSERAKESISKSTNKLMPRSTEEPIPECTENPTHESEKGLMLELVQELAKTVREPIFRSEQELFSETIEDKAIEGSSDSREEKVSGIAEKFMLKIAKKLMHKSTTESTLTTTKKPEVERALDAMPVIVKKSLTKIVKEVISKTAKESKSETAMQFRPKHAKESKCKSAIGSKHESGKGCMPKCTISEGAKDPNSPDGKMSTPDSTRISSSESIIRQLSRCAMEQPLESVIKQPSESVLEQLSESVLAQPSGHVLEQPSESVMEQSSESVMEQPSESVMEQPLESVMEQPLESVMEQPSESVMEQPSNSVMEQPSKSVMEQPSISVMEQPSKSVMEQPSESVMEQPSKSVMEQPSKSVMEQPSKSLMEQPSKSVMEQPSESVMEQPSESVMEQPSGSVMEQPSESVMEQPSQTVMEQPSKSVMEQPSESVMEQPSRSEMKQPSESVMEQPSRSVMEQPSRSEMEQPSRSEMEQPSRSEMGQYSESEVEQPSESIMEQPSESEMEQPSESGMEQTSDVLGQPSESVLGPPLESVMEQPFESVMEQPLENVMEQPLESVMEQPSESVMEQPSESLMEPPSGSILEQPSGSTMEQSLKSTMEQSLKSTMEQSLKSTVEQPLKSTMEQPLESTSEQTSIITMVQTSESVMEKPSESVMEQPSESVMEQPSESVMEQPSESVMEQPSESVMEQPLESVMEQPSESVMEQPSESVMEQPSESVMEQPLESVMEQPSVSVMEQPSVSVMEQPSESAIEQPSESVMEQPSGSGLENSLKSTMEPTSESTLLQPSESITEQPLESALELTSGSVMEQPSESLLEQPSKSAFEKPSERTMETTSERTLEQTSDSTLEQPSGSVMEQPAERSMEQSAVSVIEQPPECVMEQLSESVVEQLSKSVMEQPLESLTEQPLENLMEQHPESLMDQPSENVMEQPLESVMEQPLESVMEQPLESVMDQTLECVMEQPLESVMEQPLESVMEQPLETVMEQPLESVMEQPSESVMEQPSESVMEQPLESVMEQHLESFLDQPSKSVLEQPSEGTIELPPKNAEEPNALAGNKIDFRGANESESVEKLYSIFESEEELPSIKMHEYSQSGPKRLSSAKIPHLSTPKEANESETFQGKTESLLSQGTSGSKSTEKQCTKARKKPCSNEKKSKAANTKCPEGVKKWCSEAAKKTCTVETKKPCSKATKKSFPEKSEECWTKTSKESCSKTSKEPCSKTSKEPCSKTSKEPCSKTSKGPCSKTSKEPCCKTSKELCSKTSKEPCSKTSKEPCSKTSKEPCSKTSKEPCSKTSKEPCSKTSEEPCSKTSKDPCSKTSKHPCSKTSKESCSKTSREPCSKTLEEPHSKTSEESCFEKIMTIPCATCNEPYLEAPRPEGIENVVSKQHLEVILQGVDSYSREGHKSCLEAPTKLFCSDVNPLLLEPNESVSEEICKLSHILLKNTLAKTTSDQPFKELCQLSLRTRSKNEIFENSLTGIEGKSLVDQLHEVSTAPLLIADMCDDVDRRLRNQDGSQSPQMGMDILTDRSEDVLSVQSCHRNSASATFKENMKLKSPRSGKRSEQSNSSTTTDCVDKSIKCPLRLSGKSIDCVDNNVISEVMLVQTSTNFPTPTCVDSTAVSETIEDRTSLRTTCMAPGKSALGRISDLISSKFFTKLEDHCSSNQGDGQSKTLKISDLVDGPDILVLLSENCRQGSNTGIVDSNDLSLAQKLTASQFEPPKPGSRKTRRSMVYGYKTDKRIVEMTGENLCVQLEEALHAQLSCPLTRGGPCFECGASVDSVASHAAETHACLSFRLLRRCLAYHHHTQERYLDFPHRYSDELYGYPVYICLSCGLSTKRMDVAWAHSDVHPQIFQAQEGCKDHGGCNRANTLYSYKLQEWKAGLNNSLPCYLCDSRFLCENGLEVHLNVVHTLNRKCRECHKTNIESVLSHNTEHKSTPLRSNNFALKLTETCQDLASISLNILDNMLNYLDGRQFRLHTVSAGAMEDSDRSEITLPLFNIPEEFAVAAEHLNNPERELNRYKRGKYVIKLPAEDQYLANNFDVPIQMMLQKKCSQYRKGRKCFSSQTRAIREDDLFSVLGLKRSRNAKTSNKLAIPVALDRRLQCSTRSVSSKNNKENINEDESVAVTSRTRATSTKASPSDTVESDESDSSSAARRTPTQETPLQNETVVEVSGEWASEHTFVCCACGAVEDDLAEIMDHKWARHTGVLCAHTMICGRPGVPLPFCHQYRPPTGRPVHLPLPGVNGGESAKGALRCTKCAVQEDSAAALHAHVVQCGELAELHSSRHSKKNKKNLKFRRRKGQGIPSRHSTSASTTPHKHQDGSGSGSPSVERPSVSGIKRRLEGAISSIDNSVLKKRLTDIIRANSNPSRFTLSSGARNCGRMKLRRKLQAAAKQARMTRGRELQSRQELAVPGRPATVNLQPADAKADIQRINTKKSVLITSKKKEDTKLDTDTKLDISKTKKEKRVICKQGQSALSKSTKHKLSSSLTIPAVRDTITKNRTGPSKVFQSMIRKKISQAKSKLFQSATVPDGVQNHGESIDKKNDSKYGNDDCDTNLKITTSFKKSGKLLKTPSVILSHVESIAMREDGSYLVEHSNSPKSDEHVMRMTSKAKQVRKKVTSALSGDQEDSTPAPSSARFKELLNVYCRRRLSGRDSKRRQAVVASAARRVHDGRLGKGDAGSLETSRSSSYRPSRSSSGLTRGSSPDLGDTSSHSGPASRCSSSSSVRGYSPRALRPAPLRHGLYRPLRVLSDDSDDSEPETQGRRFSCRQRGPRRPTSFRYSFRPVLAADHSDSDVSDGRTPDQDNEDEASSDRSAISAPVPPSPQHKRTAPNKKASKVSKKTPTIQDGVIAGKRNVSKGTRKSFGKQLSNAVMRPFKSVADKQRQKTLRMAKLAVNSSKRKKTSLATFVKRAAGETKPVSEVVYSSDIENIPLRTRLKGKGVYASLKVRRKCAVLACELSKNVLKQELNSSFDVGNYNSKDVDLSEKVPYNKYNQAKIVRKSVSRQILKNVSIRGQRGKAKQKNETTANGRSDGLVATDNSATALQGGDHSQLDDNAALSAETEKHLQETSTDISSLGVEKSPAPSSQRDDCDVPSCPATAQRRMSAPASMSGDARQSPAKPSCAARKRALSATDLAEGCAKKQKLSAAGELSSTMPDGYSANRVAEEIFLPSKEGKSLVSANKKDKLTNTKEMKRLLKLDKRVAKRKMPPIGIPPKYLSLNDDLPQEDDHSSCQEISEHEPPTKKVKSCDQPQTPETLVKKRPATARKKISATTVKAKGPAVRRRGPGKVAPSEFICRECGLKFDSFDSFKSHDRDVCANIVYGMCLIADDQLYECPHCHLTFAYKSTQRKHCAACRSGRSRRGHTRPGREPSVATRQDSPRGAKHREGQGRKREENGGSGGKGGNQPKGSNNAKCLSEPDDTSATDEHKSPPVPLEIHSVLEEAVSGASMNSTIVVVSEVGVKDRSSRKRVTKSIETKRMGKKRLSGSTIAPKRVARSGVAKRNLAPAPEEEKIEISSTKVDQNDSPKEIMLTHDTHIPETTSLVKPKRKRKSTKPQRIDPIDMEVSSRLVPDLTNKVGSERQLCTELITISDTTDSSSSIAPTKTPNLGRKRQATQVTDGASETSDKLPIAASQSVLPVKSIKLSQSNRSKFHASKTKARTAKAIPGVKRFGNKSRSKKNIETEPNKFVTSSNIANQAEVDSSPVVCEAAGSSCAPTTERRPFSALLSPNGKYVSKNRRSSQSPAPLDLSPKSRSTDNIHEASVPARPPPAQHLVALAAPAASSRHVQPSLPLARVTPQAQLNYEFNNTLATVGGGLQDKCTNEPVVLEVTALMLQYRLSPNQVRTVLLEATHSLLDGTLLLTEASLRPLVLRLPYQPLNPPPEEPFPSPVAGVVGSWCALLQELVNQTHLNQLHALLISTARRQKDRERLLSEPAGVGAGLEAVVAVRCVTLHWLREDLLRAVADIEDIVKQIGNLKIELARQQMLVAMKKTFEASAL